MDKANQVGVANNQAIPPVNGTKKICPMCPKTTFAPYGMITATIGCCSKPCSEKWDALLFDEKQRLLDTAELRVQELARTARPHIVAQAA